MASSISSISLHRNKWPVVQCLYVMANVRLCNVDLADTAAVAVTKLQQWVLIKTVTSF